MLSLLTKKKCFRRGQRKRCEGPQRRKGVLTNNPDDDTLGCVQISIPTTLVPIPKAKLVHIDDEQETPEKNGDDLAF